MRAKLIHPAQSAPWRFETKYFDLGNFFPDFN